MKLIQRIAEVSDSLAASTLSPLLQRVYAARGINDVADLDYSLKRLPHPSKLTGCIAAGQLLATAIIRQQKILIFGDYDADGATSTALCLRALKLFGSSANFLLPDRVTEGYGVSEMAAKRILAETPDLVITVDTGIASHAGLGLLKQSGIKVIVTDHHLPVEGIELPAADAIINPNAFADKTGTTLAGVGVAFYLMLATRLALREQGWFAQGVDEPNLAECLDLVAIGTVADLVKLDYLNRLLVFEGIRRIRQGLCSQGVVELIRISGKDLRRLTTQDIAFGIAPRINAAGRLDDMTLGVKTLLSEHRQHARNLAQELDSINRYRKELQADMEQQAVKLLNRQAFTRDTPQVLFHADWHEGIVGILASKIKEKTAMPVICFAQGEQHVLKGSGRSVAGLHLRDLLDYIDKRNPGMLLGFGGHAMAAGVRIAPENLEGFRQQFCQAVKQLSDSTLSGPVCFSDGAIAFEELSLAVAQQLRDAGPFGQGFPVPEFHGKFKVLQQRTLAERHLKFRLQPLQNPSYPGQLQSIDAIRFFAEDHELQQQFDTLEVHYRLEVNRFNDQEQPQLLLQHIF